MLYKPNLKKQDSVFDTFCNSSAIFSFFPYFFVFDMIVFLSIFIATLSYLTSKRAFWHASVIKAIVHLFDLQKDRAEGSTAHDQKIGKNRQTDASAVC